MAKKEKVFTDKEQRVAVDILQQLEMWFMTLPNDKDPSESEQKVIDIFNKMFKKYKLQPDPFTYMCCTEKDYQKSLAEYTRQEEEACDRA